MIEETITNGLMNYGVLGLWTLSLLYRQLITQKTQNKLIENNTRAMIRVYEVIKKCPKNKSNSLS